MKSILIFSSLLFVSIAAFFQGSGVTASAAMPNYIKPGDSFDLSITITKGQLSGFSKFQMMFPEGMTVENVDTKGGTFSFVDQKLKVIWVGLPSEAAFSIQFKVTTSGSTEGTFDLGGKFSYISNGAKTDTGFNNKIVVANSKPENLEELTSSPDPVVSPSTTASTQGGAAPTIPGEPKGVFTFIRSFSENEVEKGKDVVVTLEIGKGNISGFGKITEVIPEGYTAEVVESNGAVFSAVPGEVRFMWMTLPAQNEFKVSYKLTTTQEIGGKVVKGSFSYVEDEKTRINSTSASSFIVKEPEMMANAEPSSPPATEPTTEEVPAEEPATAQAEPAAEPVANEPAVEPTEEPTTASAEPTQPVEEPAATTNPVTTSPGEVSYRVQICATRKAVDTQYFVKNHAVSETIYTDMHEGWHKFTVGGFNVYSDARNHRESVRETNKITGPFVTAYNGGARITVQEALMISKQQWVP